MRHSRGTKTGKGGLQGKSCQAGMDRQHSRMGDGKGQSWLLQLDISNVETAHILVGALESPGDVLIHRAVIKIQALQRTESRHQ